MFSFHRPHNRFSHVRGRTCWIAFSLLLVGCSGGSSTPPPPSVAATGTPGAESPWESDCLSKPVLLKPLRRTWILAEA